MKHPEASMRRVFPLASLAAVLAMAGCGGGGGGEGRDDGGSDGGGAEPGAGRLLSSAPIDVYQYSGGIPLIPIPNVEAYRILYESTDARGVLRVVSGTVLAPTAAWSGPGERPVVSFAISSQGVGDACGPSYTLPTGENYEATTIQSLLGAGYSVLATDYLGVGTNEPSTYINRLDEGHAVLDIVRAARQLPAAQLPANGPVLLYGYSQGGVGAAAALELSESYAPELNIIGGFAGAMAWDVKSVVTLLEQGTNASLLGNFLNGLQAGYPENGLFAQLSGTGQAFAQRTGVTCVPNVLITEAGTNPATLFADGRLFSAHLGDAEWTQPLADQEIGHVRPGAPVLVIQSTGDDVVPAASTQLAVDRWCAQGGVVQYQTIDLFGHLPAGAVSVPTAMAWLADRVAGEPAPSNCD
jgi:pimeloyl-ACP methyl ester carboxylesterase